MLPHLVLKPSQDVFDLKDLYGSATAKTQVLVDIDKVDNCLVRQVRRRRNVNDGY